MKRLLAGAVLVLFVGAVLGYLWHGRFDYRHREWLAVAYLSGLLAATAALRIGRPTRDQLGLTLRATPEVIKTFGLMTLAGLALILAVAALIGPGPLDWPRLGDLPVYALWAVLQQYLLQNVLRPLSMIALSGSQGLPTGRRAGPGILVAAGIFAALHLPHPLLTPLSGLASVGWCAAFTRFPHLPAAALSHVLLASALMVTGQGGALESFGVGRPGFRYQGYGDGVQVVGGHDGAGRAFAATMPGPDLGTESTIRVASLDGTKWASWIAFPEFDFSGRLAAGDLGFGPGDEIVAVPGPGSRNPALVRIFDLSGERLREFEIEGLSHGYGGYVTVACGGVLVSAGPAPGAPQAVAWTAAQGGATKRWDFSGQVPFVSGIKAWAVPGTCTPEGPPAGLLLAGTEVSVNPADFIIWREGRFERVAVFPATYGLNVAVTEEPDGVRVAATPGPLRGYPRWLRLFFLGGKGPRMEDDFVVQGPEPAAGSNIALLDLDGDGRAEIIAGEGSVSGFPPRVRIVGRDRQVLFDWQID